ncbi:MAG: Na+/H+ antiporter subunit E [Alphaproteobacteria bacterium]
MARLFPHPHLSVLLAAVWVLLINDLSVGTLLFGAAVGILIPLTTSVYWPRRRRIGAPLTVIEYALIVLWDIVVANIQVAYLILFRRGDRLRSRFITVPLDARTPEAVAVLAGTITMTPGTVSADLSADGRALLVHCLETDDPDGTVADIKHRYERRLLRVFE